MSVIKKYQKDVKNNNSTNIEFAQIKNKVEIVSAPKKEKKSWVFPTLMTAGALACGVALIVGIAPKDSKGPGTGGTIHTPIDPLFSPSALAKTATPLISSLATTSYSVDRTPLLKAKYQHNLPTTSNEEEDILNLLAQFDTILENNNNYTIEAIASEDENYKYQENISFKDLMGNTSSYSLFYNDVVITEETDEEEYEKKTQYSGIAKFSEETFDFALTLEEESEENEKEVSSEFVLYTTADRKNYTKVTYSSEIELQEQETEYSYEVYENNIKVTEYSLEIEYDTNNEVGIEIELNNTRYEIERREKDGETYFDVKYSLGEDSGTTKYTYKKVVTDGNVTYELVK